MGTPVIETARLVVRPFEQRDLDGFHGIWGDPEVIFWGASPSLENSRAGLARVIARCATEPWPVRWHAAIERATGQVVGDVMLQPAPFAPGDLEVGWHFRRDRWGRGYATEAVSALVAEGFARLHHARFVCVVRPDNVRSQRVAARVGFVRLASVLHSNLEHDLFELRRPDGAGARGS